MRKLSDIKGDAAIEFWCDILEPMTKICEDPVVLGYISGKKRSKVGLAIAEIARKHRKEVTEVLAAIEGVSVNEYRKTASALSIPQTLKILVGDPDFFTLLEFFGIQLENPFGGNVTENTGDSEK